MKDLSQTYRIDGARRQLLLAGFLVTSLIAPLPASAQNCVPSPEVSCLQGDRFQVEVTWSDEVGNPFTLEGGPLAGAGTIAFEQSDDTVAWNLEDPNGAELLVKVLDGTPITGHWWVFAAGATNVALELTVTDTVTAAVRVYVNAQGQAFVPITDTTAFPDAKAADDEATNPQEKLNQASLFLLGGRFEIAVDWNDFQGNPGSGQPISLSDTSGVFWFFSSENLELIVRMVDGRQQNGAFWFFAGATTNVEYTIRVTDTATGVTKTYTNPLGMSLPAITDNRAFESVSIVKATNGIFSETAPGPSLTIGDPVEWTYTIENLSAETLTGISVTDDQGEIVTCPQTSLNAGESMICTAESTVTAGPYENTGLVEAMTPTGAIVADSSTNYYTGRGPAVPTLGAFAAILFSGLILGIGALLLRRV